MAHGALQFLRLIFKTETAEEFRCRTPHGDSLGRLSSLRRGLHQPHLNLPSTILIVQSLIGPQRATIHPFDFIALFRREFQINIA